MFLMKSAFVDKKALYLSNCTVKQQLKCFCLYFYSLKNTRRAKVLFLIFIRITYKFNLIVYKRYN